MTDLEIIKSEKAAEATGISDTFSWPIVTALQNFCSEDLNILATHYKSNYWLLKKGKKICLKP